MITITPVNFNSYRRSNNVSSKGLNRRPEENIQRLLEIATNDELRETLIKTTQTPQDSLLYYTSQEPVKIKSIKKIKEDYSTNAEIKIIVKLLMDYPRPETVMEYGIPDLRRYARKGKSEKTQALNLLLDLINCEELRDTPTRYNLFYGSNLRPEERPGYVGLYQELTER